MRMRPLSPHLLIYRPQITSVLSILHRLTGIALSLGLFVFAAIIIAASFGQGAFLVITSHLQTWYGFLVLIGWTLAFYYHLCNGIRHLFWDVGLGFELTTVTTSGWAVVLGSFGMTAVTWFYLVHRATYFQELLSHAGI
jgi:succinate dehydrogenase / fumarate reductase cytochrome b subunit